ncbi:phosphoglucomutase/phosphomannomutase family protein [Aggregatilineales bacterium SYSU G02658]
MSIKFGTDGWRAVIAEDFTFENVRLVAQATANAVLARHTGAQAPEVVVGFDTRFLSDRFAIETACVLAANDIVVWLSRADAPTPAISYNVKAKQAAAGVMITASHNPPRYNGYKLKASYGASATAEETQLVEQHIEKLLASGAKPRLMNYEQALASERIRRFDPSWPYYQHLSQLIDFDAINSRELNVVADAMWGAGRGAFPSLLARTRTRVTEIRGALNPGFGGIHPEPIPKFLKEVVATVKNLHADVGLVTDGDADRSGAVDNLGRFVDPHHIMALSLRHLLTQRRMRGAVVKTISTTAMLDKMARHYDLPLYETPVGFNHIGDLMMKHDVLIGGEESGGISIKGHIPEGDGVLMGLLLLEVMSRWEGTLAELIADLQSEFGPAVYGRSDFRLERQLNKKDIVRQLEENAPARLNGQSVQRVNKLDGVKYYMADDSWLLIRPSGTEPVLRVYAEAPTQSDVDMLLGEGGALGKALMR